jgi:hypothetical protein
MTTPMRAIIRWIPREQGGRQSPPTGPRYSTVARFEDERDKWPAEAWSLVAEFIHSYPPNGEVTLVEVRFLSDEAPAELLRPGVRFELCEGRRVVAKGVVLPQSLLVPDELDEFSVALLG